MKNFLFLSLIILVFASGCREIAGRRVRGSGNVTSQTRSVSGFRNIEVSGAIDVYVKQDSSTSVRVEADDNILEYVQVHTDGSTLEIYTESGFRLRPSNKIKVYVSNREYEDLSVSGASSIIGENEINSGNKVSLSVSGASDGRLVINAPKVSVEVTGASSADLRGKTKDLDAHASGASKIRGYELLAENADVDISGASHAEVYASVSLDGDASGASSVYYMGSASNSIRPSGASHVGKKE
jgi:hypothetical protein